MGKKSIKKHADGSVKSSIKKNTKDKKDKSSKKNNNNKKNDVTSVIETKNETGINKNYPVILITGTPGTGKSKVLAHMSSVAQNININVSDLIKEHGLHDGYDAEFDTYMVNDKKTRTELLRRIKEMRVVGPVLIECHSCGIFDHDRMEPLIDAVIVLTCSTESLYDRLEARGYSKVKLDENLECEIMRVCAEEAREVFRSVSVVEMKNDDNEEDFCAIVDHIKTLLLLQ